MQFRYPLFDLNYGKEEDEAVLETLHSKWISMGPKTEELQELIQNLLGVKFALGVANCTAALHLACMAVGLGPGDEAVCPSLTFAATANAVRYTGAKPVFCDVVGNADLTIDPSKVEQAITDRTKAILVMHYGGYSCDMEAIMKIAREHGLFVIEDACHGPLSESKDGRKLGTIGDIGCFSFFSNKNVSTGEGGAVVTNNETFYQKMKLLRSHGMTTMSYQRAQGHATDYDIRELGYNYRLDDIRASLAIVQFKKLQADLEKRSKVRKWYLENLHDVPGLVLPFADRKEFASNYIFPTVLTTGDKARRDQIRAKLQAEGVQTSVHYPSVHRFSIYASDEWNLPNTEYISDHEITLPMYSKLSEDDVKYICEAYKNALKG